MIQAHNLTKRYGSTVAVDGLTFDLTPGLVTGFLAWLVAAFVLAAVLLVRRDA